MQGSLREPAMHEQDYRRRLRRILEEHLPAVEVYCPHEVHAESLGYGDGQGREVFFHHNRMVADSDAIVAYLPEASMGTAVEMWEAHRAGRKVFAISPLVHNWVVRFLSHRVFRDLAEFEASARSGELASLLMTTDRRSGMPGT
jgi:nucleoside 2-deoxyribosyltransferase